MLAYQGFVMGWFVSSVLMTDRTNDSTLIALVYAAVQLPLLIVTLPAGVLASRFDRRRLLLATHSVTAMLLFFYSTVSSRPELSPELLIVLLFIVGVTAALAMALWQIAGPEIVDRSAVAPATTAISGGFNVARLSGPLIAAICLQWLGVRGTLLASSGFVVLGVCLLLAVRWPLSVDARGTDTPAQSMRSPESCGYSGFSARRTCQILLLSACGSAVWALLPTLVQVRFPDDVANSLGLLTSALGAGALLGACTAGVVHIRMALGSVIKISSVMMAILIIAIACPFPLWLLCTFSVGMGMFWFLCGTTLNIFVRTEAPVNLRAQRVARFLMTFYLGMAIGSFVWGALAAQIGLGPTFFVAAICIFTASALQQQSDIQSA
ncbi:hypothetical protein VP03_26940 [Sinorhizobium meliloti]|nr:hypothetical protein VP03_26940 [Sinorhizobium meliloti]